MVRFCYSRSVNDHEAFPRALAGTPPRGWAYRGAAIEIDADRGRPWCRFDSRAGELIHASSLIPTNRTPWILETDHIGFVVQQARISAKAAGRPVKVDEVERQVVQAITDDLCLGALAWSRASERALEELCRRHGAAPPRITQAYPGVVPPALPRARPESGEFAATLDRLDPRAFKMLIVDGQAKRGASKVAGRKNVSAAMECASRLRAAGARIELLAVGSTERIEAAGNWLHVLPALEREDLWRVYGKVDLLLFLSRQESFGYLPMEAMAAGLCCLAAKAGSLPAIQEIIEHRRTGVLVEFLESRPYPELSDNLDIPQAVAEIAELIAKPEERDRLRDNAKALFDRNGCFSIEARNSTLTKQLLPDPVVY